MTNLPFTGNFKCTTIYGKKGSWAAGYHTGMDLVGITSSVVYNVCNGKVIMAKSYGSYGNCVKVKDNETGNVYLFGHLKSIAVKVGQSVTRASKIGIMGNTGRSYGTHLHFEVRKPVDVYGQQYNPSTYLGIPNKVGQYNSKDYEIDSKGYNVGDFVETNIPIKLTGAAEGDRVQWDSNGYQAWIHKSVITNNCIIARAEILEKKSENLYKLKVFDDTFDCKDEYITKKL